MDELEKLEAWEDDNFQRKHALARDCGKPAAGTEPGI